MVVHYYNSRGTAYTTGEGGTMLVLCTTAVAITHSYYVDVPSRQIYWHAPEILVPLFPAYKGNLRERHEPLLRARLSIALRARPPPVSARTL